MSQAQRELHRLLREGHVYSRPNRLLAFVARWWWVPAFVAIAYLWHRFA